MIKPEAILFDLDGTLLDTAPDLQRALNTVLAAHGRPEVTLQQARPVASHGSTGLLELGFGDDFNEHNRLPLRQAFLEAYADDPHRDTRYFAGVETLLARLQSASIKYAIVTNKPTQFTDALLPHFTQLQASSAVVCGDTLKVAKPDPAPLLYAAQLSQVDPARCWYVGDAERDIEAGRRAGMTTVLAAYGYIAEHDQPDSWQASYAISDALQLLDLLKLTDAAL
ncbi:HAD family hydrolase [Aliidiomarina sedimenti]|uniref:HAD family hydrolase n=1 Tax=Aliidiomarina sedimenti TaxID=1933879 RepID=UPI001F543889|nr:HAD-IA family hydrolase [Aliidiomarina sedimenti]